MKQAASAQSVGVAVSSFSSAVGEAVTTVVAVQASPAQLTAVAVSASSARTPRAGQGKTISMTSATMSRQNSPIQAAGLFFDLCIAPPLKLCCAGGFTYEFDRPRAL